MLKKKRFGVVLDPPPSFVIILWNPSWNKFCCFQRVLSFSCWSCLLCPRPLPPSQQNSFGEIDGDINALETVPRNFS